MRLVRPFLERPETWRSAKLGVFSSSWLQENRANPLNQRLRRFILNGPLFAHADGGMSPRRTILLGAVIGVILVLLFVDWAFAVTGITTAVIESILSFILGASNSQ